MKKHLFLTSALLLCAVGIVVFVACQKETILNQTTSDSDLVKVKIANSTKDGSDVLQLSFDEKEFLTRLDSMLNDRVPGRYIAENVTAYMEIKDSSEVRFPVFQVSVADIENESVDNLFFVLDTIESKAAATSYGMTGSNVVTSCSSDQICRRKLNGEMSTEACRLRETDKGVKYCSKCTTAGTTGTCTQTDTGILNAADVICIVVAL